MRWLDGLADLMDMSLSSQSHLRAHSLEYLDMLLDKVYCTLVFPYTAVGKESACNAGDLGLIPGLGRLPGEGNGNLL